MRVSLAIAVLTLLIPSRLAAAEASPFVAVASSATSDVWMGGFANDGFAAPSFTASAAAKVERPAMVSALALDGELLASDRSMLAPSEKKEKKKKSRSMEGDKQAHEGVLSPERARVLLQSLTVPGWGQATVGKNKAAAAFLVAEAAIWGSFTAFRVQEMMRKESYENTAMLYAGIDLSDRDEEFRRIVGSYSSSEEYNRLVVRRDAANLYYGDPAAYEAYVAEHSLRGADSWSWSGEDQFNRYRSQRQDTQRAGLRANTALA